MARNHIVVSKWNELSTYLRHKALGSYFICFRKRCEVDVWILNMELFNLKSKEEAWWFRFPCFLEFRVAQRSDIKPIGIRNMYKLGMHNLLYEEKGRYHHLNTPISTFNMHTEFSSSEIMFQEREASRVSSLSIHWLNDWF